MNYLQGAPKKCTNIVLLEPRCTGSIISVWHHLGLESVFFGRFLLRLSRIKRPQVMSRVKFGPTQHSILVMILFYKCIFLGHPPQEILLYFHTENSRTHSLHSTGVRAVIFGLQKSIGQFEEKTERCSYSKIFVNIYLPQR